MQPLTGDDLLQAIVENAGGTREDLMEKTGHFTVKADGSKSYSFTQFYEDLLKARKIDIPKSGRTTRGGRSLPYVTSVQANGNVILGSAYLRNAGFSSGDSFIIQVKPGKIKLTPLESKSDTE